MGICYFFPVVICKFIDLMLPFRHSEWFALSSKQFSSTEFRMCNIWLIRNTEELSYQVVFCCKPKEC